MYGNQTNYIPWICHGSKWRVMKAEMRSRRFPFELNLSRRYMTKCNSGVVQRSLGKGCSKRNINMHPNGHRADIFQLKIPGTGRTNLSLSYSASSTQTDFNVPASGTCHLSKSGSLNRGFVIDRHLVSLSQNNCLRNMFVLRSFSER